MSSRLLVVADGHGEDAVDLPRPDDGGRACATWVSRCCTCSNSGSRNPDDVGVRITVDGDRVVIEDLREPEPIGAHGTVDEVSVPFAEGLARMLAPLRLAAESAADAPLSGPVDFADLLGIDDVAALDLSALWAPRGERDFLRVPIGVRRRPRAGAARPEGVLRARHGPARPVRRRHRFRQVRAAAHPRPRPGRHPLRRRTSPSSSSTTRAARPSRPSPTCRTSPA